ncbi:hypothetical protein Hypma_001189 [Hypsizygus marmoreus]|uniref:Secreted protein n=1 Tax=Hypsizygus marmoreus TaxID=39966 RepID=A0A369JAH8_HYPMA|nr:hypothetical protein Hypma_001189 [Hypsizygus marmoreus]
MRSITRTLFIIACIIFPMLASRAAAHDDTQPLLEARCGRGMNRNVGKPVAARALFPRARNGWTRLATRDEMDVDA